MRITLLPETIRIDLSPVDAELWNGVIAVVKPLDVEEFMKWVDAYPGEDSTRTAAGVIVKQQLVGVEGVDFDGASYDVKNPLHFRSLFSLDRKGTAAVGKIYESLIERASLGDAAEKN